MSDWVDYRVVKAAVSMEMVLEHYGIELRRSGANLRGHCPLPTHAKRSKGAGSFSANPSKNAWACQSGPCIGARGGRRGGNVLDFVAWMESCSVRDAAIKLQEWFLGGTQLAPEKERAQPETDQEPVNEPLKFQLKGIDPTHPYLSQRGIRPETVQAFGLGHFGGRGLMHGRIVVPIHNEAGELVAYAGRWPDQSAPDGEAKYKLPPKFHASAVLFNLHRVPEGTKVVTVVEGFFDVIHLHQEGFPAVGLMGTSLSPRQLQLLASRFKGVRLFLDGDAPGREATAAIAAKLAEHLWVKAVECPQGQDPADLDTAVLKSLLT